jgi:hypothetical protein
MVPIDSLSDLFTFPNFVPVMHCAIDDDALFVRIELREEGRPQKVCAARAVGFVGRFTVFALVTFAICRPAAITSRSSSRCGPRPQTGISSAHRR